MKTIVVRTQKELDALSVEFSETTEIEIRSKEVINVRIRYKNATVYAYHSSTVHAYNSSTVHAYNSSTVYAHNSSTVYAYNSSTVYAHDSSTVYAHHSSTVYAYSSSTVYAYNSSTVYAHDSSTVYAHASSTVHARDSSTVYAYSSSTVYAYNSSTVYAYDSSTVYANNSSTVYAHHSSTVYAHHSSTVCAYHSSTVYAHNSSTVYAHASSTVHAYHSSTVCAFLCSFVLVYSQCVKIKSLLDNSRLIYKTSNGQRPEKQDPTAFITEYEEIITPSFEQWLERGYVVADGIYQELISQKTIGDVTVYETDQGFVAQKGDKFAHGKTIDEAKNDLRYKLSDRDTSKYETWKLDEIKPTDELIESYMAITGACSFGTKQFCESIQLKDSYTVGEIVELTSGKYGNEQYREFFSTTN